MRHLHRMAEVGGRCAVSLALVLAACGGSTSERAQSGGATGTGGSAAAGAGGFSGAGASSGESGTGGTGGDAAAGGLGATGGTGAVGGFGGSCPTPTAKPVTWTTANLGGVNPPAGFAEAHMFVGPGGEQAIQTISAVLAGKHAYDAGTNTFASVAPHQPPYDSEISDGLQTAGFVSASEFSVCHLEPPNMLFLLVIVAPTAGAPTGQTSDYPSGPTLFFSQAGVFVDGDTFREGTIIDPESDSFYPAGNPAYSHIVLMFGTDTTYIPPGVPTPGSYVWRVRLHPDGQTVTGMELNVPYVVK
jgi:hypothetical protein